MYLKTVFIRFYKSFNFDYLRKHHEHAQSDPWEKLDNLWYPYVRIPIDQKVTTVVGANESGKSHLLTAIEKASLVRILGAKTSAGTHSSSLSRLAK